MCDSNANNLCKIVETNNDKLSTQTEECKETSTVNESLEDINIIIKPTKQRTWVKNFVINFLIN